MSSDSETSTEKCTLGVRRDLSFLFSDKDGIGGTSRCAVGSDQDGNGPDLAFLDACARAAPGATSQHQVLAKTHIPGPQMRNTWSEV